MTGQDLLQVSYALFQELGRIILQMLCPFQPCWCPSQQLIEITGCRAASTAGQPQGFERIPAAYIQCKNVLLRPGPARGEPSPPFSPAALSAPAVRSTGGMCLTDCPAELQGCVTSVPELQPGAGCQEGGHTSVCAALLCPRLQERLCFQKAFGNAASPVNVKFHA